MKTEVFMGGTPRIKGTTNINSLPKPDDPMTILLLDTPQNTPVGTPGSDITSCDDSVDILEEIEDTVPETKGVVQRSAPQPIEVPKNQQHRRRNKKKRTTSCSDVFTDVYQMTDEILGEGSSGSVKTCVQISSHLEFAVKIIKIDELHTREKVFREIESFHQSKDHPNIIQLVQVFEEEDRFLLIFEKCYGGPLLAHIQRKKTFTEKEASMVVNDLANGLKHLHDKGMAHRDLKPENILCFSEDMVCPVKICDFDLGTGIIYNSSTPIITPELHSPVGSAEYMAPEVAIGFIGYATSYDKRCDLWSLGVIMYMMLCGYPPFYGSCGGNCSWTKGRSCAECLESLFDSIQKGVYEFPEREWAAISEDAKSLIRHLLVKDARQRYTADMILNHPWVKGGGSSNNLETPSVIRRNDSAGDLTAFAKSANANYRKTVHEVTESSEHPRVTSDDEPIPMSVSVSPSPSPMSFSLSQKHHDSHS